MRRTRIAAITAAGIVGAVLFVAPAMAGGGGCHEPEQSDAAVTTVRLSGTCFGPTVARVDAGATVTFVNEEPLPHTVTGANLLWGSLQELQQGDTIEATFATAGVYPYVCILHPGMIGAVVVGDGGASATALETGLAAAGSISDPLDSDGDPAGAVPWESIALGVAAGAALCGLVLTASRRRAAQG